MTSRPAHLDPGAIAAVAAGGFLGAPVRYALSVALPAPDGWPTATLIANLVGAFVLGFLLEALARRGPDTGRRRTLRLFAGTGFCGALTTYSTLAVEIDLLVRDHRFGLAVAYALVSVVAGLVLTVAGIAAAGRAHGTAIAVDPDP